MKTLSNELTLAKHDLSQILYFEVTYLLPLYAYLIEMLKV